MTHAEPKRGSGRPRTKNPSQAPSTTDLGFDDNPDRPTVNLKDKLTEKELRFVEIYMSGNYTQVNALKSAGYTDYNEKYLEFLARKIIGKYESQVEDHRIICRALGAGEVAVINGLLNLAQGAKSEMVRLNAWSQLSKILGLTKEILEGAGGLTIVFEGQAPGAGLPGAPPPFPTGEARPAVALPAPARPIMVTK